MESPNPDTRYPSRRYKGGEEWNPPTPKVQPMRLICPNCQQSVAVADTEAGKPIACPQCAHSFEAPQMYAAPPIEPLPGPPRPPPALPPAPPREPSPASAPTP